MATDAIGLYVHIPFCVRKCNYCDFCSFSVSSLSWRDKYIERLIQEIYSYKDKSIRLNSIFFGGGTPSLLSPSEFSRICSAIKECFEVSGDCEFSVEVNPKTLDSEKLTVFKECGVNRLSIGLQSIHENELKILGRIHLYEDFLASYNTAREFGFDNINIDLMYGLPEQTIESFTITLDTILALKPEHISVYGLIIEEGTPFFEGYSELRLPTEDYECDMYYLASERLGAAGYLHYEISNYSLPARECKHNLKYWNCKEYIGVGVAAYSYFDHVRFGNSDSVAEYLDQFCIEYNQEQADEPYEYVMLGLRLKSGISLLEYKSRFGADFLDGRSELVDRLVKTGYLTFDGDRITLTEQGFYVSNSILTELLS